jgi:hypothetical protein
MLCDSMSPADIEKYLVMVGYICYHGNNHVLINKLEYGRDDDRETTKHGALGYRSMCVLVI